MLALLIGAICWLRFSDEHTITATAYGVEKITKTHGDKDGFNTDVYYLLTTDHGTYHIGIDGLFLLENVEMGEKWEKVLSDAIGVTGVHINSALVSAQTRKRIYWTNIRTRPGDVLFDSTIHTDIPQPKDRELYLKDITEGDVPEKYYLSDETVQTLLGYNERNAAAGNGFRAKFHEGGEVLHTDGRGQIRRAIW